MTFIISMVLLIVAMVVLNQTNKKPNPVDECTLYKDKGCSHVAGMLCDFPNCEMYKPNVINKKYGNKK